MLGLTPQERGIILFLSCLALLGISADFLQKKFAPVRSAISLDADFGRIDLNTADETLLMSVSGVGKKIAGRIIAYRSRTPFTRVEELKSLKGITEKKYLKLKEYFFVR